MRIVLTAPPHMPQVTLTATTTNSITMKLKPHPSDNEPIHGYTVKYKPEFGDRETVQVPATVQKYTLENLWCGSRYQISVTAYNRCAICICLLDIDVQSRLLIFFNNYSLYNPGIPTF